MLEYYKAKCKYDACIDICRNLEVIIFDNSENSSTPLLDIKKAAELESVAFFIKLVDKQIYEQNPFRFVYLFLYRCFE